MKIQFAVTRSEAGIALATVGSDEKVGRELSALVTEEWALGPAQSIMRRAVEQLLDKPEQSEVWWSSTGLRRIEWRADGDTYVGRELDGAVLMPTIQRAAAEFGAQEWVCETYGAEFDPISDDLLVAVSDRVMRRGTGVEGTRYEMSGANSGWILIDEDFRGGVKDLRMEHAAHVIDVRPGLARYFALPPGWRFYSAPDGESVTHIQTDAHATGPLPNS